MNAKFIQDNLEIKFLILYILARVSEPLKAEELQEIALVDDGIDVFSFYSCLNELVETENIIITDSVKYSNTEKGLKNSKICESSIPFSVRIKANTEIEKMNDELKRRSQIKTSVTDNNDGTKTVELFLSDDYANIMNLKLMVSSDQIAAKICDSFTSNPEAIYMKIISLFE